MSERLADEGREGEPPGARTPTRSARAAHRLHARAVRDLARASFSYGRLSLATLAAVTAASAVALAVFLALVVTAPAVVPGLAYADIPAALIAIGGAASLAALASASAYFARTAYHRAAGSQAPSYDPPYVAAGGGASAWARVAGALHVTTLALASLAYVAFALGGLAFTHFCVGALGVLSHARAPGSPPAAASTTLTR